MIRRFLLLIILTLTLGSCQVKGKTYTIGIDPSWFPLNFQGKESNVFAFSNELLHEISSCEGVNFVQINRNWDNLNLGLEEKKYDAILSSIYPHLFELKTYSFSNLYLNTGPVLITKIDSEISIKSDMRGKEIAVGSKENEALFIRLYPEVIIRYYNKIPNALNALISDFVDGIVVNYIPATAYVQNLYDGKVKIATPPLNDAGLRLITMYKQNPELIEAFNRGLEKMRDSGKYDKLLKKWNLD